MGIVRKFLSEGDIRRLAEALAMVDMLRTQNANGVFDLEDQLEVAEAELEVAAGEVFVEAVRHAATDCLFYNTDETGIAQKALAAAEKWRDTAVQALNGPVVGGSHPAP